MASPRAPTRDRRLRPQSLVGGPGEEGDEGEGAEHGHHPHPGLERRVAEDLLHELRRVQHGGEEDGRHQQHRDAHGAKLAVAKHVRGDQGARLHPRLDQGEGDDEDDRHDQHRDHPRVRRIPSRPPGRRRAAPAGARSTAWRSPDSRSGGPPPRAAADGPCSQVTSTAKAAIGTLRKKIQLPAEPVGEHAAQQRSHGVADPRRARGSALRPGPPSPPAARRRSCPGSRATSARRRAPSRPSSRSAMGCSGPARRAARSRQTGRCPRRRPGGARTGRRAARR